MVADPSPAFLLSLSVHAQRTNYTWRTHVPLLVKNRKSPSSSRNALDSECTSQSLPTATESVRTKISLRTAWQGKSPKPFPQPEELLLKGSLFEVLQLSFHDHSHVVPAAYTCVGRASPHQGFDEANSDHAWSVQPSEPISFREAELITNDLATAECFFVKSLLHVLLGLSRGRTTCRSCSPTGFKRSLVCSWSLTRV